MKFTILSRPGLAFEHEGVGSMTVSVVAVALAIRFIVEVVFLLPSPVADPAYFLTASANLCQSGYFGTTVYPIDPTGQARMVWHGFVSPMLFSALNLSCHTRVYYLTLWAAKALTVVALAILAHRRRFSPGATLGLIAFALAAQTSTGFRPESLALLLVVAGELAVEFRRPGLLGAIGGIMLCTQPTVAGLYGLGMAVIRPELRRQWLPIGLGALTTVALLLTLYPFPAMDLAAGIRLQAQRLIGRNDGNVLSYYVLLPSLPGWSAILVAAMAFITRRRPLIVILLPVLWFFGPRVPPVYYNLLPTCLLLTVFAIEWAPPRQAAILAVACLIVGAAGVGFMSVRDVMTAVRYGDTYAATHTEIADLEAHGAHLSTAPALLAFTNPELRLTDPSAKARPRDPNGEPVSVMAVNGTPDSPCPAAPGNPATVALSIGTRTLFRSNSGWMVYVCPSPPG